MDRENVVCVCSIQFDEGVGGIVCGWLCVRATRVNYIQPFVLRWEKKTAEVIRSHEAIGDPHSD